MEDRKMMSPALLNKLARFIQEDLAISTASIQFALKQVEQTQGPLPIVLWQYGLVTIEQLDRIYEWMENIY
jgi:hypothetical protein